jgi:NAD(P)-dependent dehydrogenase (short-subunit alcohol dehydrogenase family)
MMMGVCWDFSERVAFVTGGTSGIGLATALAFARAGAQVVIAARSVESGRRTEDLLRREAKAPSGARGGEALFVACDVRDEGAVTSAVQRAVDAFGRIDFAVNCAGISGDMAPLDRASQEIWDDVMAVNMRGVWLAMRAEIPAMLANGADGGAIVNLSSIYGVAGRAAHHAYVASKHAVLGMTRSVALEYAARNVRVNAICAGLTRTAAVSEAEQAFPDVVRALVAEHPMARMATEAEIAGAALWLCSGDSGFVTGAPIFVDGGFLAA